MKLKVKDLQDYLRARQISLNHCKEKRDLVELILRHAEGGSNAAQSSMSHVQHGRQQPQANPSHPLPQNFHSARINQPRSSNFQPPPNNTQPVQVRALGEGGGTPISKEGEGVGCSLENWN